MLVAPPPAGQMFVMRKDFYKTISTRKRDETREIEREEKVFHVRPQNTFTHFESTFTQYSQGITRGEHPQNIYRVCYIIVMYTLHNTKRKRKP